MENGIYEYGWQEGDPMVPLIDQSRQYYANETGCNLENISGTVALVEDGSIFIETELIEQEAHG